MTKIETSTSISDSGRAAALTTGLNPRRAPTAWLAHTRTQADTAAKLGMSGGDKDVLGEDRNLWTQPAPTTESGFRLTRYRNATVYLIFAKRTDVRSSGLTWNRSRAVP